MCMWRIEIGVMCGNLQFLLQNELYNLIARDGFEMIIFSLSLLFVGCFSD